MWCPKCKSEYRDGITVCPECNLPLTASEPMSVDSSGVEHDVRLYERMKGREALRTLSGGSKAYVEKSTRYEDMKSTACSFLFVGFLGLVLLVLVLAGIIPIQFAAYMRYLMGGVMGAMFLAFFVCGVLSYRKLAPLKQQIAVEQQSIRSAREWLLANYTGQSIDQACGLTDALDPEPPQRYFMRSAYINARLAAQFPAFEEAFTEYLAEQLYEELYPEEAGI